jgi:hypothetical protein
MKNTVLLTCTALTLMGCGGGGSVDFATRGIQGANLVSDWSPVARTSAQSLPSGTFNYQGVAGFKLGNQSTEAIVTTADALASASITANFDQDTISGKLTDFVDYTNTRGAGEVNLRNGSISGNTFSADATGSVTYLGTPLVVQGVVGGEFRGSSADAVGARIDGFWGGQVVSGVIVAER